MCFLGLHKWKLLEFTHVARHGNRWTINTDFCPRCGKLRQRVSSFKEGATWDK